ncbi:MAG: FAD-dependent oxidoreductase [Ruminococcus sp.]|jgi:NAD(P)H-nitrite reductase large subunit|nr:FAD-dependent oxidoreductase [Ruminococcus sp.]
MNYVIIGNSAAGIGCVQGIRDKDKTGKITIISDEPYFTYSRPLISYWLGNAVTDENMKYRDRDFYEVNNVDTILGKRAVKIDAAVKKVILDDNSEVAYDKLLVGTGSKPFVPPSPGLDETGYFTFMKYDDAKAVKQAVTPGAKVLIVGAGLIGLKAAEALHEYTENITVIDLADRILSSILDEEAATIMQKHIESKGVKFFLGTSVNNFVGKTAHLKNGETCDFDILIMAVGVRPNVELIKDAGGEVNRGIITDKSQAVKGLTDIYAAGDCTESFDTSIGENRILAILPNAFLQGEIAGKNMSGQDFMYVNAIPQNAIGFFGLHIITAGSYSGDDAYEVIDGDSYKKLFIKAGKLVGFILMGKFVAKAGIYTSLIKEKIPLSDIDFNLLKDNPGLAAFSRGRRDKKLAEFH